MAARTWTNMDLKKSDWSEVTYLWWEADVIKLFETVLGDHKDKWTPKEKAVSKDFFTWRSYGYSINVVTNRNRRLQWTYEAAADALLA